MMTDYEFEVLVNQRFDKKYSISTDCFYEGTPCWLWNATMINGYGMFTRKYQHIFAHRFSYERYKGKIENGKQIDHLCCSKTCVNPEHLEAVTAKENIRRMRNIRINALKTHCSHGHPYSGANLRIDNRGRRVCIECNRLNSKGHAMLKEHTVIPLPKTLARPEKTHCPKGHPYIAGNTLIHSGYKRCRECLVSRSRATRARNKAAQITLPSSPA